MSPNSNKILHKCEICDKIFTFRKNLLAHIRAIHENIKSNKCERCGKLFSRSRDLKDHIDSVHEKLKKYYKNL